jgi:hypothetical protein
MTITRIAGLTVRTSLVVVGILGIVSCASSGARSPAVAAKAESSDLAAGFNIDAEFKIGELTDGALPKGECGMILWTLESDRPAAVFRYVASKRAEIMIDDVVVDLGLTSASGQSSYGISEYLAFSNGGGLTVTVRANFGIGFDGGNYLEQTLLSVENAEGWKSVIPSAGVAGCRPK